MAAASGSPTAKRAAAAAAVQEEAASGAAAAPPKDGQLARLFSGLAVGAVALVAVGGASETTYGLPLVAMGLLIVGPVAFGGLTFSFERAVALFSAVAGREAAATSTTPEAASDAIAKKASSASSASSSKAKKGASGEEKAGKAAQDKPDKTKDKDIPSGWDLILDAWESLPTLEGFKGMVVDAVHGAPGALAKFPGGLLSLWQWLHEPNWRPFPWVYLPDPVAFTWGVLEVLFIAPIMAVEIIATVPAMELLKAEWGQKRCAWLRETLPELVRSVSRPLGRLVLRDPRNHSYLPWMFFLGIFTPTLFFWALKRHANHGLEFSTLCIYHLLRVGPRLQFFAHIHTLAHKEGHAHRGFFRGIFQVFNCITEWWIGPFYGIVPWNYWVAHMKIHHRWHNDVDDVHTNLDLDRTNPLSFFLYVPRFTLYWTGLSPLALFIKRQEWALIQKLSLGMGAYYGVTLLLLWWNPVFALVYWVFPHMEGCVLLCAISYLWHAFVEESDPGNQYVNSVTILDGHDNVWNEDYHVVHHHAPNTHWSDAPAHFEQHREQYASVTATIFRDCEEGKLLQWMFEGNWDMMAEHFVDLNDKLTLEEKRALIVRRLSVKIGEKGRTGKRTEWGATSTIRDFTE